MPEMTLPGVYIQVRAEKLITPGRVTVGNVGVVGTASKGPIGTPILLATYAEARQRFGDYDSFLDNGTPRANSLTLVRALEQVFGNGATTVFAVRVAGTAAGKKPVSATHLLKSGADDWVSLTAKTEGSWGNDLEVNVNRATENAVIENESVPTSGPGALELTRKVIKSSRNRLTYFTDATGVTKVFSAKDIVYDNEPAPTADQVKIDRGTKKLTFSAAPAAADKINVSYLVDVTEAFRVTLRLNGAEEVYTVVDGNDLKDDINTQSAWVIAKPEVKANGKPELSVPADAFAAFKGGANGQEDADYKDGLAKLENEDVHIIVAAGQDDSFGDELDQHCQKASTDLIKRDRIAVVGSKLSATVDDLRGHTLSSDRLIFVAPGIQVTDSASARDTILPGTYAAAAIAGMLSARDPHVSLTNKPVPVGGLQYKYTQPELQQLVQARVLAIEVRRGAGIRVVKAITTDGGAFRQITTRRIVDYAKFGVRSAAEPYIGLLNNERVRGAMRATINSFLAEMVDDEMLVSYELTVTATRDEEIKGIARVTMTLRPTFSIDFIKVTMFLE